MSRYAAMFARLARSNEGAFGAFLMLGDPDLETSARLLDAAVAGGADMIEVGIPFSDPVADGPVIQAAAERALRQGVRTADAFKLIADFRRRHRTVPVGILTYANLVIAPGVASFCQACADAGADSLLIADVPAFEAPPFVETMRAAGIDPVLIAATNTPPETLAKIARLGSGYTYCLARAGVTGTDESVTFDHEEMLAKLAEVRAAPPIFGFGISRPDHVRAALDAGAAGVISGSAIVQIIAEDPVTAPERVRDFVARMKAATHKPAAA
ncbi:MAG: tryptophan synthase subunit alpha [Allosphingosinicella sp.]